MTLEIFKNLLAVGATAEKEGYTMDQLLYSNNFSMQEWDIVAIGYENPDYNPVEIKDFYRIGEPRTDIYGNIKNSWNYADDKAEKGVSVVTLEWLHSLKSVFFNAAEKIKNRGVYKISGILLPYNGGDGEPLIYPIGIAEKMRARSVSGLEKLIK